MSIILHMDTDTVHATAQQLNQAADTMRTQFESLSTSAQGMDWQGPARDLLLGDFERALLTAQELADQIAAFSQRLQREADEWEQMAQMSSNAGGLGNEGGKSPNGDDQPPLPEGLEMTVRDITTLIKIFFSDVLKANPAIKDGLKGLGLGVGILADEDFNRNLERAVAGELGKVWVKGMAAPLFLYSDFRQLVGRVLETAVRSTGNTQAADHIHTVFASYNFSAAAEQFFEQLFDIVKRALEGPPKQVA